MKLFLILMLSLSCGLAQAAVYKRVLPDGSVIFSDQPGPDAEEIETPKPQTFTPPPTSTIIAPQTNSDKKPSAPYASLTITTPVHDETIRDNTGNVSVSVSIEPPLQTQAAHKILIKLDGQVVGRPSTTQQLTLENVDRGTHTVQASVLNATGNTLLDSESVTFHMKRESTLLKKKPPGGG